MQLLIVLVCVFVFVQRSVLVSVLVFVFVIVSSAIEISNVSSDRWILLFGFVCVFVLVFVFISHLYLGWMLELVLPEHITLVHSGIYHLSLPIHSYVGDKLRILLAKYIYFQIAKQFPNCKAYFSKLKNVFIKNISCFKCPPTGLAFITFPSRSIVMSVINSGYCSQNFQDTL